MSVLPNKIESSLVTLQNRKQQSSSKKKKKAWMNSTQHLSKKGHQFQQSLPENRCRRNTC